MYNCHMTTNKLNKRHLEVLILTLKEAKADLKGARVRDSVISQATPLLKQFYDDRNAIFIEYCEKNEDGTPETKDNQYTFRNDITPKVEEEVQDLLDEEVDITLPLEIKELILNTTYSPKYGEMELIDEILAKLEA